MTIVEMPPGYKTRVMVTGRDTEWATAQVLEEAASAASAVLEGAGLTWSKLQAFEDEEAAVRHLSITARIKQDHYKRPEYAIRSRAQDAAGAIIDRAMPEGWTGGYSLKLEAL